MTHEAPGPPRRRGRRLLRGLRVQLLLWTILPLALVLVVLSVAGVTRHRQAMTHLIEDRDRGLATAEANRLGREIAQQTADLSRLAAALPTPTTAARLEDLAGGARRDLALLDAGGGLLSASTAAQDWASRDTARILAARTAAVAQPQYETDLSTTDAARLLIAVPTIDNQVLMTALPVETLSLSESSLLVEGETQGAMLALDQTGRRVHHHDPSGLITDTTIFASLPVTGSGSTYLRDRSDRELLVSYARVEPPGWVLITAEDVRAIAAMGLSVVEILPLLLLFVAVVALLAVSLGVYRVVRPLQELDRRAARVAWGDFDAIEEPVGGVQEIDDLRATLAQMAERIRDYQGGMRDYLSAITQGQEEERARLAHELHDVAIQGLIALKQRGQMAQKAFDRDPARAEMRLHELNGLIDEEIAGLRAIIGNLRPIYLEDLGFVPALEMLVQETAERHHLTVRLDVRGTVIRLPADLELAAYRIVQQALANVAAHARASQAGVEVTFAVDSLHLVVRDDGVGFTPLIQPADLARQGHFGLMGMHERALLYGGQLTITSSLGQGTRIAARLPLLASALVILLPDIDPIVQAWRARYDPTAAAGLPAHVTILTPFKPPGEISERDLADLASLFGQFPAFTVTFAQLGRFPQVLYLAPTPAAPFVELIEAVIARFPDYPPYGGEFDDIVPHLTVAHTNDPVRLDDMARDFQATAGHHLPLVTIVHDIVLLDNASGTWRERSRFALGQNK